MRRCVGLACAAAVASAGEYACWPDCDARVADAPREAAAYDSWTAPGGIEVLYAPDQDGGGTSFGRELVDYALRAFGPFHESPRRARRCFEFCAGPGFVGFSLLGRGVCSSLVLADVHPASVAAARATVARNRLGALVAVYESDALDDIPANESGTWDLVVSNPPHFRSVAAWNAMLRRRAPGAAEGASDPRHFRGVDSNWRLHERFYGTVGAFLRRGTGHVVFQENADGSTPGEFWGMLPPLRVERVEPPDATGMWYLHATNDAAGWTRRRPPAVPRGARDGWWRDAAQIALERAIRDVADQGYAVVADAGTANATHLGALRDALVARLADAAPCATPFGNPEAGCNVSMESGVGDAHVSYRLWGLLEDDALAALVAPLLRLPLVRALAQSRLGADYQLHGCTAYVATPSARPNVLHFDFADQDPAWRRAAAAGSDGGTGDHLAVMLQLQDTTAENGATLVVPGSHRWAARDPPFLPPGQNRDVAALRALPGAPPIAEPLPVAVPRGGLLLFDGATLHATGAFPGAAADIGDYRYALVLHLAAQRATKHRLATPIGRAYLRGHARLDLEVSVDGATDVIAFHEDDDLEAIAAAFVDSYDGAASLQPRAAAVDAVLEAMTNKVATAAGRGGARSETPR